MSAATTTWSRSTGPASSPLCSRGRAVERYGIISDSVLHPPGIGMADQQAPSGPSLRIEKIYLKDLSLENPGAPQAFISAEIPPIEGSLGSRGEQIEESVFECVLTLTVTAKTGDK